MSFHNIGVKMGIITLDNNFVWSFNHLFITFNISKQKKKKWMFGLTSAVGRNTVTVVILLFK